MFSDRFDVLISKIIFLKKYYFNTFLNKNILNYKYIFKHAQNVIKVEV
jgi:hypothetical protein